MTSCFRCLQHKSEAAPAPRPVSSPAPWNKGLVPAGKTEDRLAFGAKATFMARVAPTEATVTLPSVVYSHILL
jgi:hypothetical protein